MIVCRLKEGIRKRVGGFPKRIVGQVDIDGLSADAPELGASAAPRRIPLGPQAMLVIGALQYGLLTNIEALPRKVAGVRPTTRYSWHAVRFGISPVSTRRRTSGRISIAAYAPRGSLSVARKCGFAAIVRTETTD